MLLDVEAVGICLFSSFFAPGAAGVLVTGTAERRDGDDGIAKADAAGRGEAGRLGRLRDIPAPAAASGQRRWPPASTRPRGAAAAAHRCLLRGCRRANLLAAEPLRHMPWRPSPLVMMRDADRTGRDNEEGLFSVWVGAGG